jgi:hypothetical protein
MSIFAPNKRLLMAVSFLAGSSQIENLFWDDDCYIFRAFYSMYVEEECSGH